MFVSCCLLETSFVCLIVKLEICNRPIYTSLVSVFTSLSRKDLPSSCFFRVCRLACLTGSASVDAAPGLMQYTLPLTQEAAVVFPVTPRKQVRKYSSCALKIYTKYSITTR